MLDVESRKEISLSGEFFARLYLDGVARMMGEIDLNVIGKILEKFEESSSSGSRIYLMGNGGSASVASHLVNDLNVGVKMAGGRVFECVSLTDNVPSFTAIANDLSYEDIFKTQLEGRLGPGDLVVGLSVSGNSENVLRAIDYSGNCGIFTIGFTGFEGGRLREICDLNLHMPGTKGAFGPVEDLFSAVSHLIAAYFKSGKFTHLSNRN